MPATPSVPSPLPTAPIVTVVIPAFNASRYILQAVQSVLAQSLEELEVIVVDDGSTDDTVARLSEVSDPRLRVLSDTNHGPAYARNLGCRAARASRYVAFLDADDWWDRDKLLKQTGYLEANPELVAAGCFMRYVSSFGKVLGETGQVLKPADLGRVAAAELFPFPMSSLVVERTALARAGHFDETFRYAGSEDLDFVSRLASQGPLQCLPAVLGSYRVHPESAMAKERLRINFEARFVRERILRRALGGELSWDEFRASHRRSWGEWRQDLVEVLYRSAALWHGEGKQLLALGYAGLALIVHPGYTVRRIRRQRFGSRKSVRPRQGGGST
jgi:glycosyltransferase involved in cell wall biosynthesis